MEETTLEARRYGEPVGRPLSGPERFGAWFYTGPAGRLVSFSIDLGLSMTALGLYGARRAWARIRGRPQSPAA
jgi:hypothetical protein